MPTLRTRSAKGSELSHAELDANFKRTVSAKTTTYACLVSDNRSVIECNHATIPFTVTLGDAATMVAAETGDYEIAFVNIGAATVTVARAGTDTIDGGATSITLPQYSAVTLKANNAGNGYNTIANGADVARKGQANTFSGDNIFSGANTFSGVNTYSAIQKWAKGSDVASGSALALGTDGNYFDVTGTTTITSIDTVGVGTVVKLHFDGALTLTHHATDLVLPGGANITTAAGDEAEFVEYATGDWRCTNYERASGKSVIVSLTSGTAVASTSGTTVDFTSIPSWVKRITILFSGVSTDGTSNFLVQVGDSGGVESTGYESSAFTLTNNTAASSTSAFIITALITDAAETMRGTVTLSLENTSSNTWVANGSCHSSTPRGHLSAGAKSLSATLDRVRITTVGGNTFDAGEINILYE